MSERPATSNQPRLIIGLTGNIATGKSVVMRLAASRGALTIDADSVVHEIIDREAEIQDAIVDAFGAGVRHTDGRIDRRALGDIVFNDPDALRDLENIIHPAVRLEIAERMADSEAEVVFIEAIKLLEGGLADACHQIWVTRCSSQRQLDRLIICRGMDGETAAARIKAQPPQEEKVAQADVVIDTNGLMVDTEAQFDMAWKRLPDPATVEAKQIPMAAPAQPAPPPRKARPAPEKPKAETEPAPEPEKPESRPDDLQVRRARPSDIPSVLLLIQKATDGAVKMKRAELLMALSERSYLIGQVSAEISTVMGWSIDSQVARIDQIFIHPLEAASLTGTAVLEEIEASAKSHIGEIIIAFLPNDVPDAVRQLFAAKGYVVTEKESLTPAWQRAVTESQPEDTFFMTKILREDLVT